MAAGGAAHGGVADDPGDEGVAQPTADPAEGAEETEDDGAPIAPEDVAADLDQTPRDEAEVAAILAEPAA